MSHIVSIKTVVRDPIAVAAACRRLNLAEPVVGKTQLFGGEVEGLIVQLPGWNYPAVVDVATGEVRYDNYMGHWGDQAHLDRFIQIYAVEKTKLEARKQGHSVTESVLQDGSIRLQIATA